MAAVDLTVAGTVTTAGSHPSRRGTANLYAIKQTFTGAAALAAKGSALVATDVIALIDIPAYSMVMGCYVDVTTADTGTTLTGNFDIGEGDDFLDGVDMAGSTGLGAAGTNGAFTANAIITATADTLDLNLATLTAANDDWVIEVTLVLMDINHQTLPDSA